MGSAVKMSARPCPFCESTNTKYFGIRRGSRFERCRQCGSIFMQISEEGFSELHHRAWEDDDFATDVFLQQGAVPNRKVYSEIAPSFVGSGSILEIGPGSGHLLAAFKEAGHDVVGVETSEVHRRLIKEHWGIPNVYEALNEIPEGQTFSGIILINTLEHLYEVVPFLELLGRYLDENGRIFVSTVHANALVSKVCRTKWSMFKQIDHVSFPSAKGMRIAFKRAGLDARRVWTHETPFETAVSVLVAIRDSIRERKKDETSVAGTENTEASKEEQESKGESPKRWTKIKRILGSDGVFMRNEPISMVTSRLGIASSIKCLRQRHGGS